LVTTPLMEVAACANAADERLATNASMTANATTRAPNWDRMNTMNPSL
jgi:hypothetical protein